MAPPKPDDDRKIDEELLETFPASDPPSHVPETGAQVTPERVVDNPARRRFELAVEGGVAFVDYDREAGKILLIHAEVPWELRRRGIGARLVRGSVELARAEGLAIVPVCPFVRDVMDGRRE